MAVKMKPCVRVCVAMLVFALPLYAQDDVASADVDTFDDGTVYSRGEDGITINAENIKLSELLKIISIKERINIVSTEPMNETVCVNLYNMTVIQLLNAMLPLKGYCYEIKDSAFFVKRIVEPAIPKPPPPVLVVRFFRLNYLNLEEAEKFLKPLLSENGQLVAGVKSAVGIASGATDAGGNSSTSNELIMVKDYKEVVDNIAKAVADLDVRPRQVLMEATMLQVVLNDSCKLGVDFNALGGIDFTDMSTTSNLFSVISDDAAGNELENTLIASRNTGFTSDNPKEGFSFGILHDKVGLFIEALENVVDTNVIANPKVLVLNRQKAEIIIGGRIGYYGASVVSDGLAQQSVEFLETGTQLRFRPFISDDGYVRLEIHPERSSGVVSPSTGLPTETTSEITTNILVKDGDTVVIGGLIETIDSKQVKRTPYLGSLPLIGWLFRFEETGTERTEIVVMITPTIVDASVCTDKAENSAAGFMERKKLFRESFLFCSRTLYAERHLEKARLSLRKGDRKWAMYHIERAAYLNPNCEDVLSLKKRIAETWDDDASAEVMVEYLEGQVQ